MNRRSFTASLAALFVAPALPAVASLAPSAASQAATAHYATAKLLARAHNRCSPAMLQRLMRIDSAIATELSGLLLKRGVITTAGAQGVSIAVNPLNTNCIPNEAMRASNFAQKMQNAKARMDRVAKALKETEQEEFELVEDQHQPPLVEPDVPFETSEQLDHER